MVGLGQVGVSLDFRLEGVHFGQREVLGEWP
jgi:hypothetical protein